ASAGERVALRFQLGADLPMIPAGAARLAHGLTHLALNARHAMPAAGSLSSSTSCAEVTLAEARSNPERRAGRFVKIALSDTGTGIPNEVLPRIFEPFFTTKEVGKGTGLGLSAVHGMMKQHGGWVEVHTS